MKVCKSCGKQLYCNNKTGFCYSCYVAACREEKIKKWLETGNTGTQVNTTIRGVIREYILKEQNYKCAICGLDNNWNNKELKFILDHIDGDASNSCRENLRLICPNCDSQLDTYKSKNKDSARNARKEGQKVNSV